MFSRQHRLDLIKLTTKKMIYENQQQTFLNIINIYVGKILECLRNNNISHLIFPEIVLYDNDI